MSSLAATQADGYYLPPEYFEGGAYKKQSKNAYYYHTTASANQKNNNKNNNNNSNSNRSSNSHKTNNQRIVKGHNQYLQHGIVRFELPYKGICNNCHQSVGRGTRYNAKKVDTHTMYYTTKIWQFEMNCKHCQHLWMIRTNPQERGFDYIQGIKIQAGQETNLAIGDDVLLGTSNNKRGLEEGDNVGDALGKLENAAQGKRRAITEMEELEQIQRLNAVSTFLDADNNAHIRKRFRKDRTEKRKRLQDAAQKGWRSGMELLSDNNNVQDTIASKEAIYGKPKEEEKKRLRSARCSSIFASTKPTTKRRKKPKNQGLDDDITPNPVLSSSTPITSSSSSGNHDDDIIIVPDRCSVVSSNMNLAVPSKTTTIKQRQKVQVPVIVGGTTTTASQIIVSKSKSATHQNGKQNDDCKTSLLSIMEAYGSSDEDEHS